MVTHLCHGHHVDKMGKNVTLIKDTFHVLAIPVKEKISVELMFACI